MSLIKEWKLAILHLSGTALYIFTRPSHLYVQLIDLLRIPTRASAVPTELGFIMPSIPDLPDPAHADVDSMLSRKFGREVANYFSGSPLNRVSFLRSNHDFISKAFTHPTASFMLFNDLAPLGRDPTTLAYAKHEDIKSLVGENPFEKTEAEIIKEYNSSVTLPLVLFLGLDERKQDGFEHGIYKGTPFFAVDITPRGSLEPEATKVIDAVKEKGLTFIEGRVHTNLGAPEGLPPPPS
jgi:NAD+ diphosphatase